MPGINQRREVETHNVCLQFDSIIVLNHGTNDGILVSVMQVHADFVADLELELWVLDWRGTILHHGVLEDIFRC